MANVILILQIIISVFTVGIAIASFVFTILKNRVIGPKIDITEVSILDPWNKKTETIDNLVSLNGEELGESNYDCSIMLTIMNTGDRGTNISLRGMFAKFDSVEHSISDIEPLVPLNIYIDKSQIKTQEFSISVPDSYFPWLYGSLNIILCFWTHKRKFYEMLDKLNVPPPKTYFPNDISDVKEISKVITYPYIVKPVFSTNFGREFSVKCFKANSGDELIKTYNRASSSGHAVVIQEVIPGNDTSIYGFCSYFNCKFEPIGIFIYKKIRGCPEGFGLCCLVESIWEPELVKIGTQLIQNIGYHGISEIEFKKDSRDDAFKIIEMNARTWGENGLSARCGVDLSYMAYMDAIGEDVEKVISQKKGTKWLYMFDDIRSSFKSMFKGGLSFTEYINSLKGEKEYAIFAWDDPVPFLISPFNLSATILKFLSKRLHLYVKSKRKQD